jgi:predicted component of type VI protein secretion system
MAFELVPHADPKQTVPLDKAIILFGRHPDCDVIITSSRKVSRKHCCIAQINHEFVVRDLGSMNGVRVNGNDVRRESRLRVGDQLAVGDVLFTMAVVQSGKPAARVSSPPVRAGQSGQTRKPGKLSRRGMVSQDIPVVIPEEDQSFAVEESMQRQPPKGTRSEPIILGPGDILDEDDDSFYDLDAHR